MLRLLPPPLRATIALILYTGNTIGCFITILPLIVLKVILPPANLRHALTRLMMQLGMLWIGVNSWILRMTQRIEWDVEGLEGFDPQSSYLVISNHRSWADILVLQHLWKYRIPFLKFFLKKELIWVPLLGIAWWALDFPFMKRYSRQYLQKHPERKGKDIETTKKYCERFKKSPISVINFLEGSRFDPQKQKFQGSAYKHLLTPRAGGVAVVLSAMGEMLDAIIDVTIVYPENQAPLPFWTFLRGEIPVVVVRVRRLPIPEAFVGANYEQDKEFQQTFKDWINSLWAEKEQQIETILAQYGKVDKSS